MKAKRGDLIVLKLKKGAQLTMDERPRGWDVFDNLFFGLVLNTKEGNPSRLLLYYRRDPGSLTNGTSYEIFFNPDTMEIIYLNENQKPVLETLVDLIEKYDDFTSDDIYPKVDRVDVNALNDGEIEYDVETLKKHYIRCRLALNSKESIIDKMVEDFNQNKAQTSASGNMFYETPKEQESGIAYEVYRLSNTEKTDIFYVYNVKTKIWSAQKQNWILDKMKNNTVFMNNNDTIPTIVNTSAELNKWRNYIKNKNKNDNTIPVAIPKSVNDMIKNAGFIDSTFFVNSDFTDKNE